MRSKKGNLTPREAALTIIMGWAEAAYHGKTNDLYDVDDRDSFRVQTRSALAKEVNRMSARVGSSDRQLDPEDMFLPETVSSTDKYSKLEG